MSTLCQSGNLPLLWIGDLCERQFDMDDRIVAISFLVARGSFR